MASTSETTVDFSSIPEGAARANAELVFGVMTSKAKKIDAIATQLKGRYKDEAKHLSPDQITKALKALTAMNSVMAVNVKTGTKGRPPKAYKLFAEEAPASESSEAATA